jgi:hypothetical protein
VDSQRDARLLPARHRSRVHAGAGGGPALAAGAAWPRAGRGPLSLPVCALRRSAMTFLRGIVLAFALEGRRRACGRRPPGPLAALALYAVCSPSAAAASSGAPPPPCCSLLRRGGPAASFGWSVGARPARPAPGCWRPPWPWPSRIDCRPTAFRPWAALRLTGPIE